MPSDDVARITLNLTVPDNSDALDISAELEHVQENISRALMVSPEILRGTREGRHANVPMGTRVPYELPEVTREDADELVPQALPEAFREALISQFLEASAQAQRQVRAGIQAGSLWHSEYGNDLSSLLEPQELPSGPVSGPLPPWCVEGSIVRHKPTGVDYSVVRGGPEVMLREVTESESPLAHILMRSVAINNGTEWQPHPLPLTKWQRLMQD